MNSLRCHGLLLDVQELTAQETFKNWSKVTLKLFRSLFSTSLFTDILQQQRASLLSPTHHIDFNIVWQKCYKLTWAQWYCISQTQNTPRKCFTICSLTLMLPFCTCPPCTCPPLCYATNFTAIFPNKLPIALSWWPLVSHHFVLV